MTEEDWPLFNALRDWRNTQARKEGIPPYIICTNWQLAEVAHQRPPSLHKLSAIEGLGEAKLERYGAAILGIVGQGTSSETKPVEEGSGEHSANG